MASSLHVVIVGAGIAGLMTAALLEKANISYQVLEKAKELKPLGSTMSIGPQVLTIFEQLGLYPELLAVTKPAGRINFKREDMSPIGTFHTRSPGVDIRGRYGAENRSISRPDLVNLLLTLIPTGKVQYNKQVLSTKQDGNKVVIQCSDNSLHVGSILVGADGAYSSVRQNIYQELEHAGTLPKADATPMGCDFDCLVGVTLPLDPTLFPVCNDQFSDFEIILSDDAHYSWWFMPISNNRVGWMVTRDIRKQRLDRKRSYHSSEWGPEAALEMCNKVRHFPTPYRGTIGDMIDQTPQELISKVALEDKMLPFGGQGANMAILSALELVNLLYDIDEDSQEEISQVFEKYYEARHSAGVAGVDASHQMGFLMHRKGVLADVSRYVFLNWIPNWAIQLGTDKMNEYRKQISFLPYVEVKGTFRSKVNKPSRRLSGSLMPHAK
ncbi:hypothetical protein BGZ93_009963 [Podila epicladia]|nr:hypothetical protein BGZ92_004999 [Podila epicladia]KAG0098895.1 hypothetical protein BGZ93_009963 [Podila epicladia]